MTCWTLAIAGGAEKTLADWNISACTREVANMAKDGVDVTMQALTKYVGGHSDLLLGSVTTNDPTLYRRLGATQQLLGCEIVRAEWNPAKTSELRPNWG